MSDWSQRESWVVAAQDWGRRSRGATVRLSGLGEVVRGRACDETHLCLESAVEPGNYLVARADGRMVWWSTSTAAQCGYVRNSHQHGCIMYILMLPRKIASQLTPNYKNYIEYTAMVTNSLSQCEISIQVTISVLRLLYGHSDDGQHLHQVPAAPRPWTRQEEDPVDCLRSVPHLVLGRELLVQ